jgi:hypothetical protein
MKKLIAVLFCLSISISLSFSQKIDSTKTVTITLKDDNEIIGHIVSEDSLNTTVRSLSGVVSVIPNGLIVKKRILRGRIVGGEFYHPDPSDNRLLLMPTGRSLHSGEVQFNAVELFFPHLAIGASDYFNIAVGGIPFIISNGGTFIYYASAKLTPLNRENAAVSLGGAMIGSSAAESFVGVAYAVGTFGNYQSSVTFGSFLGFSKDEVYNRPAFLLGGQTRTSKSVTLITENIFLFGNETEDFLIFPSIGIRFSGEHIAADFGTYAVIQKDSFFYPIPWIGLSYKF